MAKKVTVYYRTQLNRDLTSTTSLCMFTEEKILGSGGQVVRGSARKVDDSDLDADDRFWPPERLPESIAWATQKRQRALDRIAEIDQGKIFHESDDKSEPTKAELRKATQDRRDALEEEIDGYDIQIRLWKRIQTR